MLGFHAKQKAGHERSHVDHARRPLCVVGVLGRQVAVRVGDQVPADAESQPAEQETRAEHEQRPPPLGVHQSGEQVLQVSPPELGHVRQDDVAVTVFEQCPSFGLPED